MTLKRFKQVTAVITETFTRGSRVQRKANLRHLGTVYSVSHSKEGSFANVKWDNGWKEFKLPFHELNTHSAELDSHQPEILKKMKSKYDGK
jgi:hypothetical protein